MSDDRAHLIELINACWTTQAIGTAVALGLPALLAASPQNADALAAGCECHAPSLHRLLRSLASLGIVIERDDGSFVLTARGELLRPDAPDSLDAWARARTAQWPAWGELALTVKSGEGRRLRTLGRDDFHSLAIDATAAALFHRAIAALTAQAVTPSLLASFAFSTSDRVVVDVGGGSGRLLVSVLTAEPRLCGIVFDEEHARAAATEHLAASGLAGRAEFTAGSFFDEVPPAGDVYLLKSVLHNWDDKRCTLILARCRAAMHTRARLLVVERIAPERMSDAPAHRAVAASDLNMLVNLSGRERTAAEFDALLHATALRRTRIVPGDGDFSLIEAVPSQ